MSKLQNNHVFTSESVSEGHPDEACDQVLDAILDACLAEDPSSKVACETAVTTNFLINIGEITCSGWDVIDPEAIVRQVVKDIGYDRDELLFAVIASTMNVASTPSPAISHRGFAKARGCSKSRATVTKA